MADVSFLRGTSPIGGKNPALHLNAEAGWGNKRDRGYVGAIQQQGSSAIAATPNLLHLAVGVPRQTSDDKVRMGPLYEAERVAHPLHVDG